MPMPCPPVLSARRLADSLALLATLVTLAKSTRPRLENLSPVPSTAQHSPAHLGSRRTGTRVTPGGLWTHRESRGVADEELWIFIAAVPPAACTGKTEAQLYALMAPF